MARTKRVTGTATHDELVEAAAKWLQRKHSVVVTELTSYARETPDALGFGPRWTTMIECKASRSDFLGDKKKVTRRMPERGVGDRRYYLCPYGMIDANEVPPYWGLLWMKSNGWISVKKKATTQDKCALDEQTILVSLIRRFSEYHDEGVAIRVYTEDRYRRPSKNRAAVYTRDESWVEVNPGRAWVVMTLRRGRWWAGDLEE